MLTEEILVIEDVRISPINTFSIQPQKTDECVIYCCTPYVFLWLYHFLNGNTYLNLDIHLRRKLKIHMHFE